MVYLSSYVAKLKIPLCQISTIFYILLDQSLQQSWNRSNTGLVQFKITKWSMVQNKKYIWGCRLMTRVGVWDKCKLRQLGLTNRIVNNWDSKPSKFEHWIWFNLKSDVKIRFRLKVYDTIQLISTNFGLKVSKFVLIVDHFPIKIWLKCQSKDQKWSKSIVNGWNKSKSQLISRILTLSMESRADLI